ncbi:MAG: hypothetical protein A2X81_05170 [Desulfobacterales bacterium GWB2_56_26]|nr:MAG: hypothetical protein A2X81_05170 [Desulfobacterales bacterium GWB2_56_26]
MLGDIIGEIFGGLLAGKLRSERLQIYTRMFFGVIGTFLSIAGVVKTATYAAGLPFRLAGMFLFVSLGCFCLFNITLLRKWRWPGRFCLISLPMLFVVRIVFGP